MIYNLEQTYFTTITYNLRRKEYVRATTTDLDITNHEMHPKISRWIDFVEIKLSNQNNLVFIIGSPYCLSLQCVIFFT